MARTNNASGIRVTIAPSVINGFVDLIVQKAVKDTLGHMPASEPAEITVNHPDAPDFPLVDGLLKFRPRFDDFVWGDRITGDLVSQLGYRIYISQLENTWTVIDANKKVLGRYRCIKDAVARAGRHAANSIPSLTISQIDELLDEAA